MGIDRALAQSLHANMRTHTRRGRTARPLVATLAAALLLVSIDGCELVPPQSADSAAPALLDVVGKPADHAADLLRGAGYRVAIVDTHGDPVASTTRLVVSQEPAGGTRVAAGRLVTLRLGGTG
jgi:beta-lactam-binding protein with PASTA domain